MSLDSLLDVWLHPIVNFGHGILTMVFVARPKPHPPYALFSVSFDTEFWHSGNWQTEKSAAWMAVQYDKEYPGAT